MFHLWRMKLVVSNYEICCGPIVCVTSVEITRTEILQLLWDWKKYTLGIVMNVFKSRQPFHVVVVGNSWEPLYCGFIICSIIERVMPPDPSDLTVHLRNYKSYPVFTCLKSIWVSNGARKWSVISWVPTTISSLKAMRQTAEIVHLHLVYKVFHQLDKYALIGSCWPSALCTKLLTHPFNNTMR